MTQIVHLAKGGCVKSDAFATKSAHTTVSTQPDAKGGSQSVRKAELAGLKTKKIRQLHSQMAHCAERISQVQDLHH